MKLQSKTILVQTEAPQILPDPLDHVLYSSDLLASGALETYSLKTARFDLTLQVCKAKATPQANSGALQPLKGQHGDPSPVGSDRKHCP